MRDAVAEITCVMLAKPHSLPKAAMEVNIVVAVSATVRKHASKDTVGNYQIWNRSGIIRLKLKGLHV